MISQDREIAIGAELYNLYPYVKAEVEQIQKVILNSVKATILSGTLTPDMAQQKWIEYTAYDRLLQRFEQKIRIGQDAGKKAGDSLAFK